MTAGSPHAATEPDSGSVATRDSPATVAGQCADAHTEAVADGAAATSGAREQEANRTTPVQSVTVVTVRLRVGLGMGLVVVLVVVGLGRGLRRGPPCR